MASTEQDKRLRAELAQELGFYPASLDPADIDGTGSSMPPSTRPRPWTGSTGSLHTCGRKNAAHTSKPVAVPRWPTSTSEP